MAETKLNIFSLDESGEKLPFRLIFIAPWTLLFSNARRFLALGGIFALVLSLINLILGDAYVCMMPQIGETADFCAAHGIAFHVLMFLFKVLLYGTFAYIWVNFDKEIFKNPHFLIGGLKIGILLLVCMALFFILPIISLSLLQNSTPNPDWRLEAVYFTIVSVGFLVPLFLMRFLGSIANVATSEKISSPKAQWKATKGNTFRIFCSYFVLMILAVFSMTKYYTGLPQNSFWNACILEFLYNLTYVFFFTLGLNNCLLQKQYLAERQSESSEEKKPE